jgi:hypothetical protein
MLLWLTPVSPLKDSKQTEEKHKPMGMYERSMLHLQEREQKLKQVEAAMMQDYTFTPVINHPLPPIKKRGETVWDRLYEDSKKVTPRKSNMSSDRPRKSPMSVDTNSTGTKSSSRIEQLYITGFEKGRLRDARTDKEEEETRKKRWEQNDLAECTFQPKMSWSLKSLSPHKVVVQPSSPMKATKRSPVYKIRPVALFRDNSAMENGKSDRDSPPLKIINAVPSSPNGSGSSMMAISPLREPSVQIRKHRKQKEKNEENSLGSKDTEYGSI